jgi:hypothetical protein
LAGWAAAAGSLSRLHQTVLGWHVVSTSNPTAAFSAFQTGSRSIPTTITILSDSSSLFERRRRKNLAMTGWAKVHFQNSATERSVNYLHQFTATSRTNQTKQAFRKSNNMILILMTKYMEQWLWEADRRSYSQKCPYFLWNWKVYKLTDRLHSGNLATMQIRIFYFSVS